MAPTSFLPQRKQLCLSGGHAPHPRGGSEAQQWRWETGGSCQAALGAARLIPKPPGPQQGHSLSRGAGVFGAGRPEAAAGRGPLQREEAKRGSDPRPETQDGPENTWWTPACQPRRPCPGAATGRKGDHILNPSPREVEPHNPETLEPHPGHSCSSLRSLLPPERFGPADPADL